MSSGDGIVRFDPLTHAFSAFSSSRVDDLAIAPDGSLWGSAWPRRGEILKFDSRGRASVQLRLDAAPDSIAFGRAGTALQGLLFVSSRIPSGSADPASLYVMDLFSHRVLELGRGGPSAEQLLATADGRLLVANGALVGVISPLVAPHVLGSSPTPGSLVTLPLGQITVSFDRDMRRGANGEPDSVLSAQNYRLSDAGGNAVEISSIGYDAATRTATLRFASPDAGVYTLEVDQRIRSTAGLALAAPFSASFTAVSDFSSLVELQFTDSRSDRATGTTCG